MRALLRLTSVVLLLTSCAAPEPDYTYDLLLRAGTVVDGSGDSRVLADVAIRGDHIAAIEPAYPEGIDPGLARVVVDVEGLIVAPGFIDNHAHIQTRIHERPLLENFVRQGITTILAPEHSQDQPWPLAEYANSIEMAPNVGFYAGHTWTRKQVLGMEDRAPTPEELEEMKALVRQTMEDGALGLSTGLLYVPANYAATEEIIELAKVAAEYGGLYVSHMRNEGPGLIESVAEVIRIADEADIPAQINHHKAVGAGQWGWSERTLAMIDSAREAGLEITHDQYPYTASSTGSSILFPQWAQAGGQDSLVTRLQDPELRPRIEREMRPIMEEERAAQDLAAIQFRVVRSNRAYDGLTLADLARDRGLPNTIESGIQLVMELQMRGGFSAIYHSMDEADVIRIMQHPIGMFETDGDPVGYGMGFPHPRSYGAFPRVLARYVRELEVLTLEQAIRKMSALPAAWAGQDDRGTIAEGQYADIVVFDAATVRDRATFTDPHQYPVGIHHVIVNGQFVLRDGSMTGDKPGMWLRGPARGGG